MGQSKGDERVDKTLREDPRSKGRINPKRGIRDFAFSGRLQILTAANLDRRGSSALGIDSEHIISGKLEALSQKSWRVLASVTAF
jgi:hypothetical protein